MSPCQCFHSCIFLLNISSLISPLLRSLLSRCRPQFLFLCMSSRYACTYSMSFQLPSLLVCLSHHLYFLNSHCISVAHVIAMPSRIPKPFTLTILSLPLYLFQRLTYVHLYSQGSAHVCLYPQHPAYVRFSS